MKSFTTLALLTFVTLAVATPTTVQPPTPISPVDAACTTVDCPTIPIVADPEKADVVPGRT